MSLSIVPAAWLPEIRWDTPAGTALDALKKLPPEPPLTITLFGFSPLRLSIESEFASADVDLFCDEAREEIERALALAHLRKEDGEFYIQRCWESNFRTSSRWRTRAASVPRGSATLIQPHPIDILIANSIATKRRTAVRSSS